MTLREQIRVDIEDWLDEYDNDEKVGSIKRDANVLHDEIMISIQEEIAKLV